MKEVSFGKAAVPLLVVATLVIGLAYYNLTEASSHSAVRSFSPSPVAPGGELRVTIDVADYGAFGFVVETIPDGFGYVGVVGLPGEAIEIIDARRIKFTVGGVNRTSRFNYRVRAPRPTAEREYEFSGVFWDAPLEDDRSVGGATKIIVRAPVVPTSTPVPTPVPTSTTVPTPTVTPTTVPTPDATPDATPTTVPTPDGTPAATPTTVPTPDGTPVATPVPTATSVPTPVPTATHTPIPQPSSGIGITVSSGGAHYCALHSATGSILCWGANEHGQASPPRTGRYTAIVSGETHSCALRSDGAVVCWGSITVNP